MQVPSLFKQNWILFESSEMYIKLFRMKSVFKLMLEALIGKPAVGSGGSLFDFVFLFFVLRWGCSFFGLFALCVFCLATFVFRFLCFCDEVKKKWHSQKKKLSKENLSMQIAKWGGYVDYVPVTCLDYKAKRLSCEDPFRCLLVWPLRGLGETMWINSGGAPQCWTSLDFSPGK